MVFVLVEPGAVLVHDGAVVKVKECDARGVTLVDPFGAGSVLVSWSDLMTSGGSLALPTQEALPFACLDVLWRERWASLSPNARSVALERLGDVLEVETGYRLGFSDLALEGEPRREYDSARTSHRQRVAHKAAEVTERRDARTAPEMRRATASGEPRRPVVVSTIYRWLDRYNHEGLLGLVDGRAGRKRSKPGSRFPEYQQALDQGMREDGADSSTRSHSAYIREAEITVTRQASNNDERESDV